MREGPGWGENNMSWIKTAAHCALAAGAILLTAGCTSKKDVAIAAKDDTIRRQEQEITYAEQQKQQADAQAQQAAALARQNNENIARQAEILAANARVQNEANQRLAAELDSIRNGLNRPQQTVVVSSGQAPIQEGNTGNVYRDPKGSIHIAVAGSVLFDPGRADLKPGCHETLMRIAHTLKAQYPNHAIRIEGHTDSTPVVHSRDRYPDNMALSQARAASVYDFLAKRGGISSSHIYTAGYGDRQPLVSPERTAADRAKNRRVEIVILPNNLKVQKDQLAHVDGAARPYQTALKPDQK